MTQTEENQPLQTFETSETQTEIVEVAAIKCQTD